VLIVDDQEWSARALQSILSTDGFTVKRAYMGKHGLERARAQQPDLVFIGANLPDGSGIDLCHALRDDPEFAASIPLLMTGSGRATRHERLAAMEAGAWDVVSFPIDAHELVLKLRTYLRAKVETDQIRRESLVDRATGLYSPQGLARRAKEFAGLAHRQREPLACVVLAPFQIEDDHEALTAAVRILAIALREAGRVSDAIGKLGESEFAILAPNTDAEGATGLAERLRQLVIARGEKAKTPFKVRAGYDAVSNVWETPAEAEQLVLRASAALRSAMTARTGGEWVQPFHPTGTS
jgi:PleD family two-component response regulator